MGSRAYLSNVSKRWPLARQEAVHAELTPGWPDDVAVYRDKLSPRSLKAHSWLDLRQRSSMLRPTSRASNDETIYVASLAVLAWVVDDFMRVASQAKARGATIQAHDTGRKIGPTAGADELSAAVEEFQKAKRSDLTGDGRRAGALVSAKVRGDNARARADLIWEDWFKREVPTGELLRRAGGKRKGKRDVVPMAYQTAVKLIGFTRPAAQKKLDVDVLREQRRQEALARKAAAEQGPNWLDDVMKGSK
jgi:hypothetical protein